MAAMGGGGSSDGMDIGYVDSLAIHPPFSFRLAEKKTGRTRRGYAASVSGTAANGCAMDGPKEKTLGANLHMRASSLKTGVFRICADWNRKSSTGSRHSPAFEVHFPAGLVWRRLRWRFRTPFVSLSAGAALVLAGRKIFGKFENDLRCGSFGTKFPDRIGAEGGNDRCGNIETLSQSDGGPF